MAQTDAGPAVVSAISTCVVWVAHTLCRRSQALNSTVYSPAASPLGFQWIVNSSFTPALAGCAVPKMCRPVRASTMAKDTLSRPTLTAAVGMSSAARATIGMSVPPVTVMGSVVVVWPFTLTNAQRGGW